MSCKTVQGLLPDVVTGRAGDDDARAVRAHVDACAACAAFERDVRALYALELVPDGFAVPRQLAFTPNARRSWPPRHVAAAALVAVVLALVTAFALKPSGARDDRAGGIGSAPELAAIRVAVPAPPALPPAGTWLHTRAEAERLIAYTGRPLLAQYVLEQCPRCALMAGVLSSDEAAALLAGFVLLRQPIDEGAASAYAERYADDPQQMFPAMAIQGGDCATDTTWRVSGLGEVEALVERFAGACGDAARGLADAEYERARDTLLAAPEQVAAGRYADALRELRGVEELGPERTRLAADARAVGGDLLAALDERVLALEGIAGERPGAAAAYAREMLPGLAGLPQEARVREILRTENP